MVQLMKTTKDSSESRGKMAPVKREIIDESVHYDEQQHVPLNKRPKVNFDFDGVLLSNLAEIRSWCLM